VESEQQLWQDLRNGERQAQRRLYERYAGYAMATALRYTGQREQAEDVVHDAFVQVLTNLDHFDFRGEGSLRRWVMRIVANRAADYVRAHERLLFTDEVPDRGDSDEEPPAEVPPEVLTAMIARLPAGCRLVLNLYVFEHYTHREIARRLGIKERSSASQLARARQMLQAMFKQYLEQQER